MLLLRVVWENGSDEVHEADWWMGGLKAEDCGGFNGDPQKFMSTQSLRMCLYLEIRSL